MNSSHFINYLISFYHDLKKSTIFLLIFGIFLIFADGKSSSRNGQRRLSRSNRPNFILMLTDDQDVELGSMEFMPKTLKILRDGGTEFVNGFVTTPLCCPSRSSILTGMYVHNHHVHSNNENCTGQGWINLHEPRTIGSYLHKAGYRTGYFGKYLNEYNGSYVPVGWHDWMGLVKNSRFYNYTVNFNGAKIKHGDNYRADYFTDLVANDSLTFLRHTLLHHRDKPFLAVLSFPAPHGPEDPAPHYSSYFNNVTTHRTPSWNYAPNPDKQWILQHTGKMEPVHVAFTDFLHQRRLQTLLSVDDAVQRVYNELRDLGELNNTYIIFTSDHGYHLGQFGLIKGKMMPYEFDLKVPYFIRGPGIGRGLSLWQPVANIDIAPTILDGAGIPVPEHMDGKSFLSLLKYETNKALGTKAPLWRHTLLIERGLRPKLIRLRERLQRQKERYSKDMRIQNECDQPQYMPPCKSGQQWECRRNEIGRWRIFKCRGKITVEKDCSCDNGGRLEMETVAPITRAQRRRSRLRRDLMFDGSEEGHDLAQSTFEELPLLEWEHMENGDVAHVSEEQLESWEDEFFHTVIQNLETENQTLPIWDEHDDECRNVTLQNLRIRRQANSTTSDPQNRHRLRHPKHQRRTKQLRSGKKGTLSVRGCALYANHTVYCRPEIYRNYDNWLQQKYKVDDRIRSLRNRLQDLKGVRKHLKAEKPNDQEKLLPRESSFWTSSDDVDENGQDEEADKSRYEDDNQQSEVNCNCGHHEASHGSDSAIGHPLRRSHGFFNLSSPTISDAELLAYAEERRRQRAKKKKTDGHTRKGERQNNRKRNEELATAKSYCNVPNLNCFTHDNSHWKTPPYWTLGPFCFCQNSNNNTYWCLRTINATHDFLYCEFVTGFISFYDITKDRHQLNNVVYDLSMGVIEQLSAQLDKLRTCRGSDCDRFGMT